MEWLELELVTVLVLVKLFVSGLDLSSLYSLGSELGYGLGLALYTRLRTRLERLGLELV